MSLASLGPGPVFWLPLWRVFQYSSDMWLSHLTCLKLDSSDICSSLPQKS